MAMKFLHSTVSCAAGNSCSEELLLCQSCVIYLSVKTASCLVLGVHQNEEVKKAGKCSICMVKNILIDFIPIYPDKTKTKTKTKQNKNQNKTKQNKQEEKNIYLALT